MSSSQAFGQFLIWAASMGIVLISVERVIRNQLIIFKKLEKMATEVDNLAAAVAQNTSVENSAVTLLTQLSILIKNAASTGDLAKVQQLADQINSSSAALGAAITANTPAADGSTPTNPGTVGDTSGAVSGTVDGTNSGAANVGSTTGNGSAPGTGATVGTGGTGSPI